MGGEKMAMEKAAARHEVSMFAGQKIISIHTEGMLPVDQSHATVVTKSYRVESYSDQTTRIFHNRFLRRSADVVRFKSNGTIQDIELPDGILKGYDILAVGKDGTYKAKKKGSGTWKEPKDVFGENASSKVVVAEIAKAWKFYEEVAQALPALKSSQRVREEISKLPPPKPWKPKEVEVHPSA